MNRFANQLRSLEERLDLPQPLKARILMEIAADMEDLFSHYAGQGKDEQTAESKVLEKMELSDASLQALIEVHKSGFQRFVERLTQESRNRWERAVLIMILLIVAALSMRIVIAVPMIVQSTTFVWPVLCVGFFALSLFIVRVYTLYIKKDHRKERLRRGIPLLMYLAGTSLLIGVFGYFVELYRAGEFALLMDYKLIILMAPVRMGSESELKFLVEWMMKGSSLIMVSMLVTILIALFWFMLINKVQKIECMVLERLLAG